MNEAKRQRLLKRAERCRDAAILAANNDYEKAVSAIDIVFAMEQTGSVPVEAKPTAKSRLPDLTSHVRDVVSLIGGQFSAQQVERMLHDKGLNGAVNKKSVANALKRLEDSTVRVVRRGEGRRPTFYEVSKEPAAD